MQKMMLSDLPLLEQRMKDGKQWRSMGHAAASSTNLTRTQEINDAVAGVLLEYISNLNSLFQSCSFQLVNKENSKINYRLANFAIDLKCDVE